MADLSSLAIVLQLSSDPDNPGPEEIRDIIELTRTIAVIGMSRDPVKAARRVPSYLAAKGYDIIPINPYATRILGRLVKRTLGEVSEQTDMVLVFRPSGEAGQHIEAAASRDERPVIWLQEGIRADTEARAARANGLRVVQDLCVFKVHRAIEGLASRSGAA